jgi:membrane protein
MTSPVARVQSWSDDVRTRSRLLDHLARMIQHYNGVNGNGLAGAITYFAFLSIFPILALAFFVVGYVARLYPQAHDTLVRAIEQVMPGIVGTTSNDEIPLATIESAANTVGIIGLVVLLYSGLGWLSATRRALLAVFETPRDDRPNFFLGKARDLLALVVVGLVLAFSVAVTAAMVGYSDKVVHLTGLGSGATWLVQVMSVVVGLATNLGLLLVMFRLLAHVQLPRRALWGGALLGAVGFEILKQASSYLLHVTKNQPAVQAFGIALVLVIWINYFSRLVMYAAAWAQTSPSARAMRAAQAVSSTALVRAADGNDAQVAVRSESQVLPAGRTTDPRLAFGAGAATTLALVAALRRLKHRRDARS